MAVEVKIGITDSPRELTLLVDESADAVYEKVTKALGGEELLTLTDEKNVRVIVPVAKIAYLEVGAQENRRVGFGN